MKEICNNCKWWRESRVYAPPECGYIMAGAQTGHCYYYPKIIAKVDYDFCSLWESKNKENEIKTVSLCDPHDEEMEKEAYLRGYEDGINGREYNNIYHEYKHERDSSNEDACHYQYGRGYEDGGGEVSK